MLVSFVESERPAALLLSLGTLLCAVFKVTCSEIPQVDSPVVHVIFYTDFELSYRLGLGALYATSRCVDVLSPKSAHAVTITVVGTTVLLEGLVSIASSEAFSSTLNSEHSEVVLSGELFTLLD